MNKSALVRRLRALERNIVQVHLDLPVDGMVRAKGCIKQAHLQTLRLITAIKGD